MTKKKEGATIGRPREPADPDPRYRKRINSQEAKEEAAKPDADPIGVSGSKPSSKKSSPAPATPPPEPDTYLCANCRSPVSKGDAACPICEMGLNWSSIS